MNDKSPIARSIENAFYSSIAFVHKWTAFGVLRAGRFIVAAQGRIPIAVKFFLGFALMGGLAWLCATHAFDWLLTKNDVLLDEHLEILKGEGIYENAERLRWIGYAAAGICGLAAVLSFVPIRACLWVMKAGWAMFALYWLVLLELLLRIPSTLNTLDHRLVDTYTRNDLWLEVWARWLPLTILPALVLLGLVLRPVHNFYTRAVRTEPMVGDRVVENVRTGGSDPKFRVATNWSVCLFAFVLVLPFLIRGCGMERPYGLHKGSGNPVVEIVKVKKVKKPKLKKFVVNKWSPIILERMKVEDIKTLVELEEETQDRYETQETQAGKLGKGGGKTGGWPHGMADAKLRFIRLIYSGDWNQDMRMGADKNLMAYYNQITGFPVEKESEGKKIARLRRFPKDHGPPFVFLTGNGALSGISSADVKTLQWYLTTEGGMIFADNGGGGFDRAFRGLMRRVFPDKALIDIPTDDPIFRAPYGFPNGAPPLWKHSGSKAQGIRHEGRWVVFYHQGDINDAWKDGHSGVSDNIAEQAYRMGINVIYYAFNRYHEIHFE